MSHLTLDLTLTATALMKHLAIGGPPVRFQCFLHRREVPPHLRKTSLEYLWTSDETRNGGYRCAYILTLTGLRVGLGLAFDDGHELQHRARMEEKVVTTGPVFLVTQVTLTRRVLRTVEVSVIIRVGVRVGVRGKVRVRRRSG